MIAWYERDRERVVIREAASVILLRRTQPSRIRGVLRAPARGSSFMASAYVFPGGAAEPGEDARTAAARELFEEAGVLLAQDAEHAGLRDARGRRARTQLRKRDPRRRARGRCARRSPGSSGRPKRSCRGRTGSRRRSSRSGSPRGSSSPSCRPGRSRSSTTTETVDQVWVTPHEALARAGELQLPPPQIRTCWELAQLRVDRRGARGRSRARRGAASDHAAAGAAATAPCLLLPWDPEYTDGGHRRQRAADVSARVGDRPEPVRRWRTARGSTSPHLVRRPRASLGRHAHAAVLRRRAALLARPRARWPACLRAMHDARLHDRRDVRAVARPRAGRRATLAGPRADLAQFLDAARAAGLAVVLRPGPHVNAELTSFGIPDWVLAEPACQARTVARHAGVAARSAARVSDPVVRERRRSARACAPGTRRSPRWSRRISARGPVVAIGVDNEAQLFFRTGAFDLDYHPDALAWWREARGARAIRRARGIPPTPRAARCGSRSRTSTSRVRSATSRRCSTTSGSRGIARFHNLPPGHHGLYDLRRIQRAIGGPVGIDAYTPRALFPELRRRALALRRQRIADADRVRGRRRLLPVVPAARRAARIRRASAITC